MDDSFAINKLAKVIVDTIPKPKDVGETLYGTIVSYSDNLYVRVDGSDQLTPVKSAASYSDGERVAVLIKDHKAVVTGNFSHPSATEASVESNVSTIDNKITELGNVVATKVSTSDFEATNATVKNLVTDDTTIKNTLKAHDGKFDSIKTETAEIEGRITAAEGDIDQLQATQIKAETLDAKYATIENLNATNADVHTLQTDYADVTTKLTAAEADISDLSAKKLSVDAAKATYATIDQLQAGYAHISDGVIDNATIDQAKVNNLSSHYATADLANVSNAWINKGVVRDGAISDAMIGELNAGKITSGTLDAGLVDVSHLNASSITTGKLTVGGVTLDVANGTSSVSGSALTKGSVTMDRLDTSVKDAIDGAIETWTVSAVPTLSNAPASKWTDAATRDKHVGDIAYVVNSGETADGYAYRFAKSSDGTYSWVLIKDSDVTAALSRLTTAEGNISGLQTFEHNSEAWQTKTDSSITTLMNSTTKLSTRMDTAEGTLANKVDISTFNTVKQAVDENSSKIVTVTSSVETAQSTADTAKTAAAAAQSTADTAKSNAEAAQTTANTAVSNAKTAQTTADTAKTNAATAQGSADSAARIAFTAQNTADTAVNNAKTAQTTADTAVSNAKSAQSTASAAMIAAANAQKTADDISVGGRNLLLGTGAEGTASGAWTAYNNYTGLSDMVSTIEAGDKFIFSFDGRVTDTTNGASGGVQWRINYFRPDGTADGSTPTNNTLVDSTDWARYIIPMTVETGIPDGYSPRMLIQRTATNAGVPVAIKRIKLERGNRATDWTPAPEDVDASIGAVDTKVTTLTTTVNEVKQTADENSASITSMRGTISSQGTRLTNAESSIKQNADAIAMKVSSSTYSSDKAGLEAKITSNSTAITQKSNELSAKIASTETSVKSYADGKVAKEVTDRNAAITAASNGIKAQMSETYTTKTEFNALEIGGRNLVKGTSSEWSEWWTPESNVENSTHEFNYFTLDEPLKAGDAFSISLDFEWTTFTPTDGHKLAMYFQGATDDSWKFRNPVVESIRNAVSDIITNTDGTTHINGTATIQSGSRAIGHKKFSISARCDYSDGTGKVRIKCLKVERGTRPTDWTPAPEDMATGKSLSDLNATLTTQYTKTADFTVAPSQLAAKFTSTENSVKSYADGKVSAEATARNAAISATADGVKSYVAKTYATKDTTNAISSKLDQTASGLTSEVQARQATDKNLADNYLTAAQVASKIQQSADSITTSVSKTYATQDALSTVSNTANAANNHANVLENGYTRTIDLHADTYNTDYFYPCVFDKSSWIFDKKYSFIVSNGDDKVAWSSHNTKRIHAEMDFNFSPSNYGWLADRDAITITKRYASFVKPNSAGCPYPFYVTQSINVSKLILFLRGGAAYKVTSMGADGNWTVYTTEYDAGNNYKFQAGPSLPTEIGTDQSAFRDRITTAESKITQNANAISTEVTARQSADKSLSEKQSTLEQTVSGINTRVSTVEKSYVKSDEYSTDREQTDKTIRDTVQQATTDADGKTIFEKINSVSNTVDGMTNTITTISSETDGNSQALKELSTTVAVTQENGQPVLTLGSSASTMKTRVTNEAMEFLSDGKVLASASGDSFRAPKTDVDEVKMGRYTIRERSTGGIEFVYG